MTMAAIAIRASFQKSLRRFSPGRPSGLIRCTAIMRMMMRDRIFDNDRLRRASEGNEHGCRGTVKPARPVAGAAPDRPERPVRALAALTFGGL